MKLSRTIGFNSDPEGIEFGESVQERKKRKETQKWTQEIVKAAERGQIQDQFVIAMLVNSKRAELKDALKLAITTNNEKAVCFLLEHYKANLKEGLNLAIITAMLHGHEKIAQILKKEAWGDFKDRYEDEKMVKSKLTVTMFKSNENN